MAVWLEESGSRLVRAHVDGAVGRDDAVALHDALEAAPPDAEVLIEFHDVRCEPLFIALLASDIRARPGQVQLRGLCWYEARLLRYLGVEEHHLGELLP